MTFGPIVITLPGAPRGKGRGRPVNAGGISRMILPSATRDYQQALRFAGEKVMDGRAPIDEAIELLIFAYLEIPASWSKKKREAALRHELRPTVKPDFDNLAKTIDGLNTIVWVDDKQIVDGRVIKLYSDRPRLVIEVRPVGPYFDFM